MSPVRVRSRTRCNTCPASRWLRTRAKSLQKNSHRLFVTEPRPTRTSPRRATESRPRRLGNHNTPRAPVRTRPAPAHGGTMRTRTSVVSSALFLGVACTASVASADPRTEGDGLSIGHVYTETNDATANAILVFDRSFEGRLSPGGSIATGGQGTGAALASQGALAQSHDGRWLLAVNAGSNTLSVLEATDGWLAVRDVADSGGTSAGHVTELAAVSCTCSTPAPTRTSRGSPWTTGECCIPSGTRHGRSAATRTSAPPRWPSARRPRSRRHREGEHVIDTFRVDARGRALPGMFANVARNDALRLRLHA